MNIRVIRRLAVPVVLALFALQGCEEETVITPDTQQVQLNGSVVKSNGTPLDSAEIVLLFHVQQSDDTPAGEWFALPNPATAAAQLHFTVPAPNTFVNARVLDPLIGTVAAAPANFVAAAGEHVITWDLKQHPDSARAIRNGWYSVRLDIGGQVKTTPLLVNSENSTAFATTDSTGRFFIDYRYIPRDSTAALIEEDGTTLGRFTVIDSVTVVARRNGHAPQRKIIGINRSQSANVKFTF